MKVRIGFGLGAAVALGDPGWFGSLVDGLEALGFDSLWLSERITGPAPDPIVGLSVAAGRTARLKLGTSVLVLPGRNPVVLAKELASLDVLSRGRLLPAFGLGVADPGEQQAFAVERAERAAWFDEALPLIRRVWTEDEVDHDGPRFSYRRLRVQPKPLQSPPEVWLGGAAPSELRRVGRLGDGWLPSFCVPEEAAAGRQAVEAEASRWGRSIDAEHFGALVTYSHGALPERLAALLERRRPGGDATAIVPAGLDALRLRIARFVEVGFSKFVVVPAVVPRQPQSELEELASAVLSLQTR